MVLEGHGGGRGSVWRQLHHYFMPRGNFRHSTRLHIAASHIPQQDGVYVSRCLRSLTAPTDPPLETRATPRRVLPSFSYTVSGDVPRPERSSCGRLALLALLGAKEPGLVRLVSSKRQRQS